MADRDYFVTKQQRSLTLGELGEVAQMMQAVKALPPVFDASLRLSDANGEVFAEVWWDSESEEWLADISRQDP